MSYAMYVRKNYDSLKIIFLSSVALGISPFNKSLPPKYKSLPVIYAFLLMTWYSVQICFNFYFFKQTEISAPSIAIILQKSCENLVPILAILRSFQDKGETPRQILDELSFSDQCLYSVGIEVDVGRVKKTVGILFKCACSYIIFLFTVIVITIADLNLISFSRVMYVLFFLSHFFYTIFFTFFICSVMYSYTCRFQSLNDEISMIIFSGLRSGSRVIKVKPYKMDQLRTLNTIKFVHSIYRELVARVCQMFSILITLQLFQCFTVITLMVYMMLCAILSGQIFERGSLFSTMTLLTLSTHYLVIIIYPITWSLTRTSQEANKMESIIHELMNETEDLKLLGELENFSRELIHSRVVFTACDFFTIDYTLFTKIAGAVVSYVIIFMQFGSTDYNEFFYIFTNGKYTS